MREVQTPTGRLHLVLSDPHTGKIVEDRWVNNLVTSKGRELLGQLLTGIAPGIERVQLVVGGYLEGEVQPNPYPPAAPGDVGLHNQLRRVDTVFESTAFLPATETEPPRFVVAISAVMPAKADDDKLLLREAGLVMAKESEQPEPAENDPLAAHEVLYNRVVFDTVTKDPQLQVSLTWEIKL